MNVADKDTLLGLTQSSVFLYVDEVPVLARLAQRIAPPQVIVEIGAAYGASSTLFLLNSHALVYAIDPFVADPHTGWQSSRDACIAAVARGCANAGDPDAGRRWRLWEQFSADAAREWDADRHIPRPIGLLFIDGDHSYKGCREDVDLWLPLVAPGGYLLLHDSRRNPDAPDPNTFDRGWQGPTQVAEELRHDARVRWVENAHSLTVWQII